MGWRTGREVGAGMTVMVVDKTVVGIGGRLRVAVGGGHEVGGVEHLDANFQSQNSIQK